MTMMREIDVTMMREIDVTMMREIDVTMMRKILTQVPGKMAMFIQISSRLRLVLEHVVV